MRREKNKHLAAYYLATSPSLIVGLNLETSRQYLATGECCFLERPVFFSSPLLCVTSSNGLVRGRKKNCYRFLSWIFFFLHRFFAVSLLVPTPSVFAKRYERLRAVCIRKTAGSLCSSSPTWAHKATRSSRGEKTQGVGEDNEEEKGVGGGVGGRKVGFTGQCPLLKKTDSDTAPG